MLSSNFTVLVFPVLLGDFIADGDFNIESSIKKRLPLC